MNFEGKLEKKSKKVDWYRLVCKALRSNQFRYFRKYLREHPNLNLNRCAFTYIQKWQGKFPSPLLPLSIDQYRDCALNYDYDVQKYLFELCEIAKTPWF